MAGWLPPREAMGRQVHLELKWGNCVRASRGGRISCFGLFCSQLNPELMEVSAEFPPLPCPRNARRLQSVTVSIFFVQF